MPNSSKKKGNPPVPPDYQRLAGSEHPPHPKTRRLGAASADEIATIQLIVRRRPDGPPIKDLDYFQKTPLRARKLPSRQEFEEAHGSTQADLDAVGKFCRSHHLQVLESNRSRRWVVARGTVAHMGTAFAVELREYESPQGKYRGFDGAAHLPAALAGVVEAVNGLDNRPVPGRHLGLSDPAITNPLSPPQVAQLYNFPSGTGHGQTIGILAFPGWGYTEPDIQETLTNWGVPAPAPPTAFPAGSNPGVSAFETIIDITVATAVAPGATIVVYFLAAWTAADIISTLTSMIHPTGADPVPTIINICLAFSADDETSFVTSAEYAQMDTLFQDAANLAITVLSGCSDNGAYYDNPAQAQTVYPGSDPWVLCCGGTTVGNISGSYFDEYVWNDTWASLPPSTPVGKLFAGASGGGISALWPVPPYQSGLILPKRNNTGLPGRGIPDVAGNASPNSGYLMTVGGDDYSQQGGTSVVAPLYAGLVALINGNLGESVGFLNPTLYALAASVCRDVTGAAGPTNNNFPLLSSTGTVTGTVIGYPAGVGWDACTGWGSIDGSALLSILQGILEPSMTFIMDRTTFSQDEVAAIGGVFNQAFFVVVDGLRPGDFPNGGITATSDSPTPPGPPNLAQLQQWAPTIGPVGPGGGATNIIFTPTAVSSEGPTLSALVQRFTFTYQVTFPDETPFTTPSPAAFPLTLNVNASLAAAGGLNASAQIELIRAADPYFSSESNGGLSWLSDDIRVFYAIEGSQLFGAPALGNTAQAACDFIQWITSNLSGPLGTGPNGDTFEYTLATDEQASALSLSPTTPPIDSPQTLNIYNFAIARVRLDGSSTTAPMVRVFFRLFQGQSTAIPYQSPSSGAGVSSATGPYRQWSDGQTDGRKIPLLGISADGTEYVTVPCFASPRVLNTSTSNNMTTQQDAPWNATPITPETGLTVYKYFGCWLDTNQSQQLFPYQPGANPDGPFTGQTLYTLGQVLVRGGHQCLVVEIVDDEAPILDNATPSTSDKIAQRNLAFTVVANPGVADSRLATHTFEIRPSLTTLDADRRPDELMIEWGNVPKGSVASIYLPAVTAADVLSLAARMYPTHNLAASDRHTLLCRVGGTTYIPIPKGSDSNYAGLFSVELPPGIKKGQEFRIVVRQVTSVMGRTGANVTVLAARKGEGLLRRRYVYGTFQITIPVSTKAEMLLPEERFLSIMRWIHETIPPSSRWYPVFLRYLEQIAGRVSALGGDPAKIPPTQTGIWPGLGKTPGHGDRETCEKTGKINGLIFDQFGDFDGFLLRTDDGEHKFSSREKAIEELADRAWRERLRITVSARRDQPHRPLSITVREPPVSFWH